MPSVVPVSTVENDPQVIAALARKHLAEADKFAAEAEEMKQRARNQKATAGLNEGHLKEAQRADRFKLASDIENQVYRLTGEIDPDSVAICVEHLTRWSRLNPGSPMVVKLNSRGGYVTSGMDLFDTILELRRAGHHITMVGRGYVASMASILLQAGSVRVM